MNNIMKLCLIIIGSISLILGILGIFLPLLPTTPFLLLAAACYTKVSDKMYKWLINNKYFGSYIKNYQENKGLAMRTKVSVISILWLTIGYSILFIVEVLLVKLLLLIIAGLVTWHILSLNTLEE